MIGWFLVVGGAMNTIIMSGNVRGAWCGAVQAKCDAWVRVQDLGPRDKVSEGRSEAKRGWRSNP